MPIENMTDYAGAIKYIDNALKNGRTFNSLISKEKESDEFFINSIRYGWKTDIIDKWVELVKYVYTEKYNLNIFEEFTIQCSDDGIDKAYSNINTMNLTAFINYINQKTDMANISLEKDSKDILYNIHKILNKNRTVRGLILGSPRSNKTTSSLATISLAADIGWNIFIIITGYTDRSFEEHKQSIFDKVRIITEGSTWAVIDPIKSESYYNISKLKLNQKDHMKYILMVPRREEYLDKLEKWLLSKESSCKNAKIMIVDEDEYRVGSNISNFYGKLNKNDELISKFLIKHSDNDIFKSLVYLKITSNAHLQFDRNWHPASLFPCDFIKEIAEPPNYFGPNQIFDTDQSTNPTHISEELDDQLDRYLNDSTCFDLPSSLKSSILWFVCSMAIARYKKITKPQSMLIICSSRTHHRNKLISGIKKYLSASYQELSSKIRLIFDEEITIDSYLHDVQYSDIEPYLIDIFSSRCIENNNQIMTNIGPIICTDLLKNDEPGVIPLPNFSKEYTLSNGYIIIGGYSLQTGTTIKNITSVFMSSSQMQTDSMINIDYCCCTNYEETALPHWWTSGTVYKYLQRTNIVENIIRKFILEKQITRVIDLPKEYSQLINDISIQKGNCFTTYDNIICDRCGCEILKGETCCRSNNPKYHIICNTCYTIGKINWKENKVNFIYKNEKIIKRLFNGDSIPLNELGTSDKIHAIKDYLTSQGLIFDTPNRHLVLKDYEHCWTFARDLFNSNSQEEYESIFHEYEYKWRWIINKLLYDLSLINSTGGNNLIVNTSCTDLENFILNCKMLKSLDNSEYIISQKYKYRSRGHDNILWKEIDNKNKLEIFSKLIHMILTKCPEVNIFENQICYNDSTYEISININRKETLYANSKYELIIRIDKNDIYCIDDNGKSIPFRIFFKQENNREIDKLYTYCCNLYGCWS